MPRGTSSPLLGASTWTAQLGYWAGRQDPAVVTGSTSWSGAELLARAAGACNQLRALGPENGVIPALLSSTAGALAYVIGGASAARPLAPLGPRLTRFELGPVLDHLGAEVLLCGVEWEPLGSEMATGRGMRLVVVDEPAAAPSPLDLHVDPLAPAFVLHTSGTTGQPKPVAYRQDRLAARVRINVDLCSLGPGAIYATASPFHHIAGLGNYSVALAGGAAVVPLPRFTTEAWVALAKLGVTHALTVPTVLEMLLDAGVLALPELRTLQYGGSPIHPDLLARTLREAPGIDLVNLFGQTEGSPITCLGPDDHRLIDAEGRVELLRSVGRPAPGVDVRIDDPDSSGVGDVVACAEPFFSPGADGWLHTGDLGAMRDGYLFLSGRRGDKIIRGGENIYPLEVETVLAAHPAVREAAVIGVPDAKWGEVVKGVVVAANGEAPLDFEVLRAYARERLAGFKVPTTWAAVDALPRNAGGKVVRRLLQVE